MESRVQLMPIVQANSARVAARQILLEAPGHLQGILETRLKRTYGVFMPDYSILLALWEAPGHRLHVGELAGRVVYSPSRITYPIPNLSCDGWMEHIPSVVDRRGYDACLTAQGIETVFATVELYQQTASECLLDDMTDADTDSIAKALATLDSHPCGGERDPQSRLAPLVHIVLNFYSLADRNGSRRSPVQMTEQADALT